MHITLSQSFVCALSGFNVFAERLDNYLFKAWRARVSHITQTLFQWNPVFIMHMNAGMYMFMHVSLICAPVQKESGNPNSPQDYPEKLPVNHHCLLNWTTFKQRKYLIIIILTTVGKMFWSGQGEWNQNQSLLFCSNRAPGACPILGIQWFSQQHFSSLQANCVCYKWMVWWWRAATNAAMWSQTKFHLSNYMFKQHVTS